MPCSFIYARQTIVNKHSQQNNQQNPVSQMPTQTEVNAPVTDPYALFLAEQQKREAIWSVNRAAKKPKTADVQSLTMNTPTKRNDSVATQTPSAKTLAIHVATQTSPTLQQSTEEGTARKGQKVIQGEYVVLPKSSLQFLNSALCSCRLWKR